MEKFKIRLKAVLVIFVAALTVYCIYPKYEMVDSKTRYNKITGTVEKWGGHFVPTNSLNPFSNNMTGWWELK